MLGFTLMFIVLFLFYFAFRVNRIEYRMNVLEKALNAAVKEGKLDTEYLGKPFGGDSDGLLGFLRAVKQWSKS